MLVEIKIYNTSDVQFCQSVFNSQRLSGIMDFGRSLMRPFNNPPLEVRTFLDIYYKIRVRFPKVETLLLLITQSKSKTIITRSMLTISLIVFTDKFLGHVYTFYSK